MATKPAPPVCEPSPSKSANSFKATDKSSNIYQGNPREDTDKLVKTAPCVFHLCVTPETNQYPLGIICKLTHFRNAILSAKGYAILLQTLPGIRLCMKPAPFRTILPGFLMHGTKVQLYLFICATLFDFTMKNLNMSYLQFIVNLNCFFLGSFEHGIARAMLSL